MSLEQTRTVNRAPRPSGLADVLDVVLDKGIVIDAYVRVAVVGIELLTIDARIVIASVDTYLRFAEAVNRLDLQPTKQVGGLPGMIEEATEGVSEHKTKGVLSGAKDSAKDTAKNVLSSLGGKDRDEEDDAEDDGGEGDDQEESDGRQVAEERRPERARASRSRGRGKDGS